MKKIFVIHLLLLITTCGINAQHQITGLWYSEDSTRIYRLLEDGNGMKAVIHQSARATDTVGVIILTQLYYQSQKRRYTGLIHSMHDRLARPVKIYMEQNGTLLRLKIPRMFLFPVYIRWKKMQ
jgi:hypothetical protein